LHFLRFVPVHVCICDVKLWRPRRKERKTHRLTNEGGTLDKEKEEEEEEIKGEKEKCQECEEKGARWGCRELFVTNFDKLVANL